MSSRDDGARDERAQAEEQAWRDIVDHYGERATLPDDEDEPSLDDVVDLVELVEPVEPEAPVDPALPVDPAEPAEPVVRPDPPRFVPYADHFVPPPLPPPPDIATDRRFAWVGLVVPPLMLLLVVVLRYPLPGILTAGLVVAFLGSFGYLVATMSRDPRDPDDDGARL